MYSHNRKSAKRQFVVTRQILHFAAFFWGTIGYVNTATAEVTVEAYAGAQMGVGKVTLELSPSDAAAALGDYRFSIDEQADRAVYPAGQIPRDRKILRNLLGIQPSGTLTYYFLFLGDAPLKLRIYAPDQLQLDVTPQRNREKYATLLDQWWEEYLNSYKRVHDRAEFPLGPQTYLTAMWSARLGRPMPQLDGQLLRDQAKGGVSAGVLLADEAYRATVLRDLMLNQAAPNRDKNDHPLPSATVPVASAVAPQGEIEVDPIASHVPAECFYVRFGTFNNYLWFRSFMKRWQGDLGNMLVLRSIHRDAAAGVTTQLCLQGSGMSELLGPQLIDDVAIVGMDPYLREGAAIGVMFHAKNSFLLSTGFAQKRKAAVAAHQRATEQLIDIAGHKVSFVSSPDGVLHSYYAMDGQFHLITTSRIMVKRFYEAGSGERPLAAAADFVVARESVGVTRNDSVFAHLSSAFLTQLVSPAYRIEFLRRLQRAEAKRCVVLAELAAEQERFASESIDDLIFGGYLSPAVRHALQRDLAVGPIADSLPTACSTTELESYAQFVDNTTAEVGALVPITVAIHRNRLPANSPPSGRSVPNGVERIGMELYLQRYSATNLASAAKKLGSPSPIRLAPIADDVASAEVVLSGTPGSREPLHLFAGLCDTQIPWGVSGGALRIVSSISDSVDGYVGAWPRPEMLERVLGRPRGPYDNDGIAQAGGTGRLLGLWTSRVGDFLLFSFKRHVLSHVGNQLAMVDAARPAQAWLTVRDIAGTKYEQAASAFGYARARQTSASGSRFMNSLVEQLHVEPSRAKELANELVVGELICPLGGEYVLVEVPGGVRAWTSSAASPSNRFVLTEIPGDYQFPLLEWFRGVSAELLRGDDSLHLSAELIISDTRPAEGPSRDQPPGPNQAEQPAPAEQLPAPSGP